MGKLAIGISVSNLLEIVSTHNQLTESAEGEKLNIQAKLGRN